MKASAQRKPADESAPVAKATISLTKAQQTKVDALPTVSARIRYLDSEGLTRSQITKVIPNAKGGTLLYQHVRNVLVQDVANAKAKAKAKS